MPVPAAGAPDLPGNCGGASLEDVLKWYRLNTGADNLDFEGSQDQKNWNAGRACRTRLPERRATPDPTHKETHHVRRIHR